MSSRPAMPVLQRGFSEAMVAVAISTSSRGYQAPLLLGRYCFVQTRRANESRTPLRSGERPSRDGCRVHEGLTSIGDVSLNPREVVAQRDPQRGRSGSTTSPEALVP